MSFILGIVVSSQREQSLPHLDIFSYLTFLSPILNLTEVLLSGIFLMKFQINRGCIMLSNSRMLMDMSPVNDKFGFYDHRIT